MVSRRQWIPLGGLLATIAVAAYMVVQLNAQTAARDYSNAAVVEVRDAQGQVVLSGHFAIHEEDDDDIERKATLQSTGVDSDASGSAEVEISRSPGTGQELEFSIRNVQPGSKLTFAIDGQDVTSATADRRGRIEIEIELDDAPADGTTPR